MNKLVCFYVLAQNSYLSWHVVCFSIDVFFLLFLYVFGRNFEYYFLVFDLYIATGISKLPPIAYGSVIGFNYIILGLPVLILGFILCFMFLESEKKFKVKCFKILIAFIFSIFLMCCSSVVGYAEGDDEDKNPTKGQIIIDFVKIFPNLFFPKMPRTPKSLAELNHVRSFFGHDPISARYCQNMHANNLNFEAVSKGHLMKRHMEEGGGFLNSKFSPNSNEIMFLKPKANLEPRYQKGGDFVIIEDKKLIVIELKFRYEIFESTDSAMCYLQNINNKYSKNLDTMPVLIHCAKLSIYRQLLYASRECVDMLGNPWPESELEKLTVLQLQSFKKKPEFEHMIISNKSGLFQLATGEHSGFFKTFKKELLEYSLKKNILDNAELEKFDELFIEEDFFKRFHREKTSMLYDALRSINEYKTDKDKLEYLNILDREKKNEKPEN